MHYDFVDIGTSFFCTSVDDFGVNCRGLLVDPVKPYLDVIPSSDTIVKANYAISDSNRTDLIYLKGNVLDVKYVSKFELDGLVSQLNSRQEVREEIQRIGYGGCSSLGKAHNVGSDTQLTCQVITFDELCKKYNITSIGLLKIDTEGHEHRILPQVYEAIAEGKLEGIDTIVFEYNSLSDKHTLDILVALFADTLKYTSEFKQTGLWDSDMILRKPV